MLCGSGLTEAVEVGSACGVSGDEVAGLGPVDLEACSQRYRWDLEKNATQMPGIPWPGISGGLPFAGPEVSQYAAQYSKIGEWELRQAKTPSSG